MSKIMEQFLEKSRTLYRGRPWVGILLVFIVILIFHGWSLMRFPQPFVDEAWAANRAWSFLQTGRVFGTLDSDFMTEFPGYWTYFPLLSVLAQAGVLQFLAVPSLLAVRLVSFFWGLVLLGCIYWIARRLLGQRHAVVSLLLVAFSWPFCISAHWARADIMAAALGYGAIALYLAPKTPRFWTSLIAGLMVGLAFEAHPNAAIFGPALVALSWATHGWGVWKRRDFWGIVAGGALGIVFYAALHILRYPATYFTFQRLFFSATHTPPLLTLDPGVILEAFRNMAISMFLEVYPLSPLVVLGIFSLWRSPSVESRQLIAAVLSLALGYTLWVRNKMPYYPIVLTPIFDVAVAGVVLDEISRPWRRQVGFYARRILVWGLVLASLVRVCVAVQYPYDQDYQNVQQRINAVIAPGESIIGPQTYWFGLYEHDYDSWEELVYYRRYRPEATVADAFAYLRPDVLILDGLSESFIRDDDGETLYSQYLRLPRRELSAFLQEHGQLVREFDGGCYGWVRVYRLYWHSTGLGEWPLLDNRADIEMQSEAGHGSHS